MPESAPSRVQVPGIRPQPRSGAERVAPNRVQVRREGRMRRGRLLGDGRHATSAPRGGTSPSKWNDTVSGSPSRTFSTSTKAASTSRYPWAMSTWA